MAEDACHTLVALVARLAEGGPVPRRFLMALGREGAGIRSGPLGLVDLAVGGRNRVLGRGLKPAYDDGSRGQVRHFTGVATSTALLGAGFTRWASLTLRRDGADTPDGRLSEAAVEFASLLLSRKLAVQDASAWVRDTLCDAPRPVFRRRQD
ncbi:MAG: hypothetical protein JWR90_2078 [Marmoricola sp.]|jgi:hypothetical protein|nr:hypothetical protein [Marmoricola sp.]